MNILHLKELQRDLTEENAGRVAVHVEWLVRTHPKFQAWAHLPHLANTIARCPNKKSMMLLELEMIIRVLQTRKSYRNT